MLCNTLHASRPYCEPATTANCALDVARVWHQACYRSSQHMPCMARLQTRHRASRRVSRIIVNTYPEPETEKERSTIDFPQEWITPQPSRRPDIFPEFEKLETPLPKPLPGDPELPEDEEEEEKEKKEEPEKDPEEEPEKPQQPPPEE